MNVYVESNFVLERALEQEECDSCIEIIRLASDSRLKLVIPAFSLAEPHQAIFGKASHARGLVKTCAFISVSSDDRSRTERFRRLSTHWLPR